MYRRTNSIPAGILTGFKDSRIPITDWFWSELTTSISVVNYSANGNCVTVGKDEKGRLFVHRWGQDRKRQGPRMRVEALKVWTTTGKAREMVDMMQTLKMDILWIQETRWTGNRARSFKASYTWQTICPPLDSMSTILSQSPTHNNPLKFACV